MTMMRPSCIGSMLLIDRAAVLAEELARSDHAGTLGSVETSPLRLSVKLCLYSPRLSVLVTLLT